MLELPASIVEGAIAFWLIYNEAKVAFIAPIIAALCESDLFLLCLVFY